MEIVAITDDLTEHRPLLAATEALHRQLRPAIPGDYVAYMERMFFEGAEMAVLLDDGTPRALAVYRMFHTTYNGLRFYVDDLNTDEFRRGQGYGGTILAWCEARAAKRGCETFALDSGTHRVRAHKFYLNFGLVIASFAFSKTLR